MKTPGTGLSHWIWQRISACVVLLLLALMICILIKLPQMDYAAFVSLMQSPAVAIATALLIVAVFFHAALGMQTVLEDYISVPSARHLLFGITCVICATACVLGIAAIARIFFAA